MADGRFYDVCPADHSDGKGFACAATKALARRGLRQVITNLYEPARCGTRRLLLHAFPCYLILHYRRILLIEKFQEDGVL